MHIAELKYWSWENDLTRLLSQIRRETHFEDVDENPIS